MTLKSKTIWKPKYWDTLTDNQRNDAFNGVGPEYFPHWVRNLLDMVLFWAMDAVYVHDVEYTFSTSKTLADFRFLINCLLYAGLNIYRICISFILFFAVLFFGKKAWEHSKLK